MKNLFGLLFLACFLNCKSTIETKVTKPTHTQIQSYVEFLSSDEILGRDTGSEGIEQSAVFIENKFKEFGIKPYYDTYRDHFNANGLNAYNVVGYLEGNDPDLKNEAIIIGAHYDHIGVQGESVDNDSINNGANDNASGTATVMALAQYFGANKSNKRGLIFALFSAEELGMLGSGHLAKKLKTENLDLYAMINFEMTGVPFPDRDYVAFISGFDRSNMADKINEYVSATLIGESAEAKKFNLFKRSDNYPFYKEFQVACQTISSCDLTNYNYYHHVDDEAYKMDYEHMANLVNQLIPAIERMSNTPSKEIKMYLNE